MNGYKPSTIVSFKGEIAVLECSPDRKRLVVQYRRSNPSEGPLYHSIDRLFFKRDTEGFLSKERWHLCLIHVASGKTITLTDGSDYDDTLPGWSPDGRCITFLSNRHPSPDLHPDAVGLYMMPSDGGELQEIRTPTGPKNAYSFSPDGKLIAYTGHTGMNQNWKNSSLWIVPIHGRGRAKNITARYDLEASHITINDLAPPITVPPVWSADGHKIFFQASAHGNTLLQTVDLQGNSLDTIVPKQGIVQCFDLDRNRKRLVYIREDPANPGDLWSCNLATGLHCRISHLNQDLLDTLDLGKVETCWVNGQTEDPLQGWILKPSGFSNREKYPAILSIHGGPHIQYGYTFMFDFHYLASHGYIVYYCNPSGSTGYGEAYTKAIANGWGVKDNHDLIRWDQAVTRRKYLDSHRKGVMGHSYGGYLTNWLISHTVRFKAAVSSGSISNLVSFWGTSDYNWWIQEDFGMKSPMEDVQRYWNRSPLKYAGKVKTPTLILHNEKDLRCPVEQGEQFFVALKKAGITTKMLVFPDEPHNIVRTDRRIVRLLEIREWFDRFLKNPVRKT